MALAEPLPDPAGPNIDPETGGTLTIDLDAVEANWRALAHQLLTVECAAVVKANAYGLGLEAVTAKLAKAGCKTFSWPIWPKPAAREPGRGRPQSTCSMAIRPTQRAPSPSLTCSR